MKKNCASNSSILNNHLTVGRDNIQIIVTGQTIEELELFKKNFFNELKEMLNAYKADIRKEFEVYKNELNELHKKG